MSKETYMKPELADAVAECNAELVDPDDHSQLDGLPFITDSSIVYWTVYRDPSVNSSDDQLMRRYYVGEPRAQVVEGARRKFHFHSEVEVDADGKEPTRADG